MFNFVVGEVAENCSSGLLNIGVELANDEKLCYLDNADYLVCLFECTEHLQHALDRLTVVLVQLVFHTF